MGFEKPQDYVVALKKLEGFPLMGMEVRDGHLVFASLSRHVSLPLRKSKDWGYKVVRYSLNKLDVLVDCAEYNDQLRQVRLLDGDGDVIAHVTLRNVTRLEWLRSELHGKNLRSSVNVNTYKKYVRLADGVAFTWEADGLTGVFINWSSLDSRVSQIVDQGDVLSIMTDAGGAVELFFGEGKGDVKGDDR